MTHNPCTHCWHDRHQGRDVDDPKHGVYVRVPISVIDQRCCQCGEYQVIQKFYDTSEVRADIAPRMS